MNKGKSILFTLSFLALMLVVLGGVSANTVTNVNTNVTYPTIQAAISAASAGDTINVSAGSYNLSTTLVISKSLNLIGEDKNLVVITSSSSTYGIEVTASNVLLQGFTLSGAGTYGLKIESNNNFTLRNVIVQHSGKSEIDLNKVNGATIQDVVADGQNTPGVGIALTNSNSISLNNVNTENNQWGGVGLYDYPTGPTHDITFGTGNNFSESNPIYIDTEYHQGVFNISLSGFNYVVTNPTFQGRGNDFKFYQQTEPNAVSFALTLTNPLQSAIRTTATDINGFAKEGTSFVVANGMSIQTAISTANLGDTINVAPGTYSEQLTITKNLTLIGSGIGATIIQSPLTLTTQFITTTISGPANNKPIIYVGNNANAIIENLTVDGLGRGNSNPRFEGIAFYNADGTVQNTEIKNILETPLSGSQHGVAIYANNQDGTSRKLIVTNNNIHDYQKNGMALVGNGLTAIVTQNTVTGSGLTPLIAQNGIQISSGAIGNVANNQVSGNDYLINSTGQDCTTPYPTNFSNLTDVYNKCATAMGILFYGANTNSIAQHNLVINNGEGIYVDTNISGVNYNAIYGNRYFGIDDNFDNAGNPNTAFTLNALGNYYGATSPTQSLNPVSDISSQISYSPWFTDSSMTLSSNGALDLSGIKTTVNGTVTVEIPNEVTLNSSDNNATGINVTVVIPLGTNVTTNDTSWDGTILPPTFLFNQSNGTLALPPNFGDTALVNSGGFKINTFNVYEIGSPDSALTFSQPVNITFPGIASLTYGVGYSNGTSYFKISLCNSNNPNDNTFPSDRNDCYYTSGNDIIILTKHFTQFVTFTASCGLSGGCGSGGTVTSANSGGSGGSGGASTPATTSNPTNNANLLNGTGLTTPESVQTNKTAPITGAATNAAPITGGVIGTLTSTWGIIGIVVVVVALVIIFASGSSRRKNKERVDKRGY